MNPRFMYVDDDADARNLVTAILTSLGCDVDCLDNGETALETLGSQQALEQYDAILLDVMMPRLSGYAVLERIRKMPYGKEVPIIMLTAKDGSKEVAEGYAAGASYYITKPFTKDQLIYALDLFLGEEIKDDEENPKEPKVHKLDYNPDTTDGDKGVMVIK